MTTYQSVITGRIDNEVSRIARIYDTSVRAKFGYALKGEFHEAEFPKSKFSLHHTNNSEEEGLVRDILMLFIRGDVVSETFRTDSKAVRTRYGVRNLDVNLVCRTFGYGQRWHHYEQRGQAARELKSATGATNFDKLKVPEKVEIKLLDIIKIDNLLNFKQALSGDVVDLKEEDKTPSYIM